MSDALTNCPKCGFNQPVDQYCANCGVDMLALQKKSASSFSTVAKQPAAIAAFAVAAIAIAFGASRMMRRAPQDDVGTARLASLNASHTRKENLKAQASPQIRQAIENRRPLEAPLQTAGTIAADVGASGGGAQGSSLASTDPSQVHFHPPGETAPAAAAVAKGATADASKAAPDDAALQIAFAWTEVSREWLAAMGATDPGLHRVPDLEARLRESKGAYRILEVSKQKIEGGMTSFGLRRGDRDGDRTALKVEIASVTETSFSGSIQMNYRGPEGAVRAPAAAAMSIDKGQGSILTFAPAPPPPGVAPTGAEIVVLILPRWGADRNP